MGSTARSAAPPWPNPLEARVRRDDVVIGLALLAVATPNPSDVADAVVEAVGQTLEVDSAVLVESAPGQRSTIRAAWFGTEAALDETHPDPHADLHAVVATEGGPLVVEDLRRDHRFAGIVPTDGPPSSGVAVVVGGAPGFHGSLSALSASLRTFDDDESSSSNAWPTWWRRRSSGPGPTWSPTTSACRTSSPDYPTGPCCGTASTRPSTGSPAPTRSSRWSSSTSTPSRSSSTATAPTSATACCSRSPSG